MFVHHDKSIPIFWGISSTHYRKSTIFHFHIFSLTADTKAQGPELQARIALWVQVDFYDKLYDNQSILTN